MIPVTVLISTSPRPSHPSTRIIDETISSMRSHLPDAPMFILCDGPTGTQEYADFQMSLLRRYGNVFCAEEHNHQSGMLGSIIGQVQTRLILFLEDDWWLYPDIEWDVLGNAILSGQFNYIKFHAAPRIHPLHEEKMGEHVRLSEESFVRRTKQWSQNPHLASTDFYRELNEKYLKGTCDFIENIMVGHESFDHKLGILNPVTGDMMRCKHLDGDQP